MKLRDYQTDAISSFLTEVHRGMQRGLIVLPTGCGKTILGIALAKKMNARTLWIAHREELITQPLEAVRAVWPDVNAGVVKAERNEWARDFVFASIQTAWRPGRIEKLTDFDLVVVDEAHHVSAASYRKVFESVGCFTSGGPPLLGLTATPERSDSLQLDDTFEKIVYHLHLKQAVESGHLVDVEIVSRPINVDLDSVGTSRGDYSEGELDEALLEGGIVDNVRDAVKELAKKRKTIIFTVSVRQSKAIAEALQEDGVKAAWVAGITPREERKDTLKRLKSGELTHVVNCAVLSEGFDEPSVDCIVMARPTKSKCLYVQCVGRGLRIAPNKERCLIVDMVGLSSTHTLIQAPVIFGLEGEVNDDTREAGGRVDPDIAIDHRSRLLLSQAGGLAPLARSQMRWIPMDNGGLVLGCGEGGNVVMLPDSELWRVDVVGRGGKPGREPLTMDPVGMELAQGIAEDYARRSAAVYMTSKSASWRDARATEKQIQALSRWQIQHSADITKGEASDLLTRASAGHWRNDPATPKQIRMLESIGVEVVSDLTKGEAGKLISATK